jgi:hypothetical protein
MFKPGRYLIFLLALIVVYQRREIVGIFDTNSNISTVCGVAYNNPSASSTSRASRKHSTP